MESGGPIAGSTSSYEMLGRLGRGEVAEVLLARHHLAHEDGAVGAKLVALKRLRPELAADPALQQMLVAEARLGAGFNHPNLAEALDLGQHEGQSFFTMEWVAGHELGHLARIADSAHGRMPLLHAVTIVAALAAALDYAHELKAPNGRPLNVVHLDVSPSNVLVEPHGFVKLVDFGIARHDLAPQSTWHAHAGARHDPGGPVAYRSPEHCRGGAVDRRSDVFSLGVILWELTVWSRLFHGASDAEIQSKIIGLDAMRPTAVRADFPAELEAIVMQALARDPNERFGSARALLVALEEFAYAHRCTPSTTRLGVYVRELMPQGPPLVATAQSSHNTTPRNRPTIPEQGLDQHLDPAADAATAVLAKGEDTSVGDEPIATQSVTLVPPTQDDAPPVPPATGVPEPIEAESTSPYSVSSDGGTPPMGSPSGSSGSRWRR